MPLDSQAELEASIARSKAIYAMVNEGEEFEIVAERAVLANQAGSKIERLGIGKEILRLKAENRLSNADIAERFNVSASLVGQFLRAYEKAKPAEQARMRRTSIFDTYEQWERLGVKLDALFARVETQDYQISVQVLGEMRKTIESADKFMQRISEQQKVERIRLAVEEILLDELPEKRTAIMQRFAAMGLKGSGAAPALPG